MGVVSLIMWILAAGFGLFLLVIWTIGYDKRLAWYSVIALVVAAIVGLTMAIRRISVYRAKRASERFAAIDLTAPAAAGTHRSPPAAEGPPERNFPLPVVIIHGVFAVTTLTLVLLTALDVGGG